MGIFEYTGGSLWGYNTRDPNVDEFERSEKLRKTYRSPAEQTVQELGEGRGKNAFFFEWREFLPHCNADNGVCFTL